MIPIRYVEGDATRPIGNGLKIITHICNNVGGWGAGFVLAISKRWKEPERQYRRWAQTKTPDFILGSVQFVDVERGITVANLIGQEGVGWKDGIPPIRYEAVEKGLSLVINRASAANASVHMPRIGCGLAGGKWSEIEPLVIKTLSSQNISVTVYDLPRAFSS